MLLIHREQERYNQGKMEGLQMGRQSGLTEGLQMGMQKGKEEGKEEALHAFVLNMLKSKSPIDMIHQYTDLPLSEIMAIAKKNNLPL